MSLEVELFNPTPDAARGLQKITTYGPSADAVATGEGAGYFNELAKHGLRDGDFLIATYSDATKIYQVAVTAGVVTLPLALTFA